MSSISPLLLTYFVTGLTIGFGHCIGMCGPLVVSLSLSRPPGRLLAPHLLYNCGRTLTYMVMGGVMGATGSFAIVAANIAAIQKGAMFFAGVVIIIMGLTMGGWLPRISIFQMNYTPGPTISRWFKRISRTQSTFMYLPIGLLLGLLPCGPVYTTLLGAARAGMEAPDLIRGTVAGMLLMAAFGVGTMPALLLVAKLADMGWLKIRDKIYKVGAILMIGVGIYFICSAVTY